MHNIAILMYSMSTMILVHLSLSYTTKISSMQAKVGVGKNALAQTES